MCTCNGTGPRKPQNVPYSFISPSLLFPVDPLNLQGAPRIKGAVTLAAKLKKPLVSESSSRPVLGRPHTAGRGLHTHSRASLAGTSTGPRRSNGARDSVSTIFDRGTDGARRTLQARREAGGEDRASTPGRWGEAGEGERGEEKEWKEEWEGGTAT